MAVMKPRKIPMRMCVGCREMKPKKELLRVVRTPEGEAKDRPVGGLGIHMYRKIMDSVTYKRQDNKNILTLTKRIR